MNARLRPGMPLLFAWAMLVHACPAVAQSQVSTLEVAQAVPRLAPTAAAAGEQSRATQVNSWTVGVAGGFFEGTFIRFAVELAKALDDGDNLRILPIVSYGGNENINDLLYLKGIDIAITYTDTFELYKKSGQVRNIEQRINYISELLVGELYIFGRPEILFERLGIRPEFVHINNTIALEKMKTGEIDAIVSTGGKPNDLFVKLKPEPGFHFIPVEYGPVFSDYYLPCPLSHADYAHLIPEGQAVDTLCMSAVLAVYNFPKGTDQARRLERFIRYYFERFDKLKQPSFHPKWRDVNLAAKVPGWNRYWLAADKLAAMEKAASLSDKSAAKPVRSGEAIGTKSSDQEALFKDFLIWMKQQEKR
jgi:hypothetical protein